MAQVRIKQSVCQSSGSVLVLGNVVDVFKSAVPMVFDSPLTLLDTLRFRRSDWLHVSVRGTSFLYFFSKFNC